MKPSHKKTIDPLTPNQITLAVLSWIQNTPDVKKRVMGLLDQQSNGQLNPKKGFYFNLETWFIDEVFTEEIERLLPKPFNEILVSAVSNEIQWAYISGILISEKYPGRWPWEN